MSEIQKKEKGIEKAVQTTVDVTVAKVHSKGKANAFGKASQVRGNRCYLQATVNGINEVSMPYYLPVTILSNPQRGNLVAKAFPIEKWEEVKAAAFAYYKDRINSEGVMEIVKMTQTLASPDYSEKKATSTVSNIFEGFTAL